MEIKIEKITCPLCGKDLRDIEFVSYAHLRRAKDAIIANHVRKEHTIKNEK